MQNRGRLTLRLWILTGKRFGAVYLLTVSMGLIQHFMLKKIISLNFLPQQK